MPIDKETRKTEWRESQMARTEPHYRLGDRVMIKEANVITIGRVFGYEWSDGRNVAGKPKVRYRGWFYWFREEGSDDECCIPENKLVRA